MEAAPAPAPATLAIEDVFGDLPMLATARLTLRRFTMGDAPGVFDYARDPEVARYVMWEPHSTIDDSCEFISWCLDRYAASEIAPWAIVLNDVDRVIGSAGFAYWNTIDRKAEIGYSISRAYWNRGFTTEAVQAILDFGFEVMQLNRIEARCIPENVASARVMEKCGMSFEGLLRDDIFSKGSFNDLKLYSILRREWREQQQLRPLPLFTPAG